MEFSRPINKKDMDPVPCLFHIIIILRIILTNWTSLKK